MKKLLNLITLLLISHALFSQIDVLMKFQKGDTISLESHDLIISISDQVDFSQSYETQKVRDSLKRNYSNHHRGAKAFEDYKLKIDSKFAKRHNDTLFVKLKDDSWFSVHVDLSEEYEQEAYNYENYFREKGYYLIRIQYPEGNGYKLINDKTGKTTYLFGDLFFYNDTNLAISINCDIDAGYCHNGLQLFDFSMEEPHLIFKYSPEWWGPSKIKWISDKEVAAEIEVFTHERGMWRIKLAHVKIKILERQR